MPKVYIAGYNAQPILKSSTLSLKELAAQAVKGALKNTPIEKPDCLLVSNMLADELEGQKHLGPLIATESGLSGIETWHIRAATAAGSAAIRAAWLAIKSGELKTVAVVGVEIMHGQKATPILAKALDLETEISQGHTMISINADLMKQYLETNRSSYNDFSNFAVNAHRNAMLCEHALLKKEMTTQDVATSRIIHDPIRLSDCSPVCDGAAAIVLTSEPSLALPEKITIDACEVATDNFSVSSRSNPLELKAAALSSHKAFERAQLTVNDIDFFELHDAFSIMSCLALEACGFAKRGEGWKLARNGDIFPDGNLPIATCGGLKARGHPVGATALYQACEIISQLRGTAGKNQLKGDPRIAMMQSIGGAGATLITSIFSR